MPAAKYLGLVAGKIKEIIASVTSVPDAIPALDSSGRLDVSVMPVGVAAEVLVCATSENLTAGNFVNLYLNASVITARKADATTNGKPAHGFVLANSTSPANATVYFPSQVNTAQSGLTIGSDYFLGTTAGAIQTSPPSSAGNIVQFIGRAQSATAINFINSDTVEVA